MLSSPFPSISNSLFHYSPAAVTVPENFRNPQKKLKIGFGTRPTCLLTSNSNSSSSSSSSSSLYSVLQKSVPLAASFAILLWSNPVNAGILSGFPGIESVPGPQLPQIDFLNRFNEENQKKYAEFDARFKSSPLLNELLERSKLNKEKNKQEIQDKYCIRGAEWGVGDCSTEGMTPDEKDKFIAMLKQKTESK